MRNNVNETEQGRIFRKSDKVNEDGERERKNKEWESETNERKEKRQRKNIERE